MSTVKPDSVVAIRYIGTLDNGRIFTSTEDSGPMSFAMGAGELFPALENAIVGMCAGEVKNIVLTADEAYGQRLQENIICVSRQTFPAGKEITIGQNLSIEFKGGHSRAMTVMAVDDREITLDGNHPLAGCDLTFALQVETIKPGVK